MGSLLKEINIGMVGYQFMGKAHSHAFRDIPFFFNSKFKPVMQAISGRNEKAVKNAAEQLGWGSYETDWRRLIERDDIDVIDIVSPNNTHAEIAIAAAEAGKHVISEKPLALSVTEAERMHDAVKKNKVVNMVCHNYRYAPAVQYTKKLIENGMVGRIYHFRGNYLQDFIMDQNFPISWRLKKEISGTGALGDIGAHIIDLARFLVGDIEEVVSTMATFVKQRPISYQSSEFNKQFNKEAKGEVTVDDATAFLARFKDGAIGTFEATRFAGGNRNKNKFEINGEKASIRWDLENLNNLEVYFTDDEPGHQGFRLINCTEKQHPYAGQYWAPGHIIGYEHTFIHLMYEFFNGIAEGRNPKPDFEDGLKNQQVIDAVEQSAATKSWVSV